jgi:hypothetical protein
MSKEKTSLDAQKLPLNISGSSHYLTVRQLNNACKKHPYILARFASGHQMGINSKIAAIAHKIKKYSDNELTQFVSFLPCDLNAYITHKHPFM